MPYSQITLAQFVSQVSDLMDDPTAVYWTVPEIQLATFEALRVFGAYTNYWRARGSFNLVPQSTFYDMAVQLPTLRTRTYTLDQMVREIQYMLLENPSGLSGAGMSGQVDISDILTCIFNARNRFVLDSALPISQHTVVTNSAPPDGMVEFDQSSVFVHSCTWQDSNSLVYTNLWRQDPWAADRGLEDWTVNPTGPVAFSEAENAPLKLQMVPPPFNAGNLTVLSVDSIQMDLTNPATLFLLPDEWVHAVKYAALSQILSSEGQIKDPVRAEYAENRYQQALQFAKDARSIIRLLVNGKPVPVDTLVAMDAGDYFWRNRVQPPSMGGLLYDQLALTPPDQIYGAAVDVVQTAPLPRPTDFMQIGTEELDNLKDYVSHVLTFKCGGGEFKSSMSSYDSFMKHVDGRKAINKAKIIYMTPLFGQPNKEQQDRPDKIESAA